MKDSGTQEVVQEMDDRYFLVKDEEGRFHIAYKDDNGELQACSATFKNVDFVPGMGLFCVTDETDSCGLISANGSEVLPCFFQTIVMCSNKIVLVDYRNKPYHIFMEDGKDVKDILREFCKKLELKDVFDMGRVCGFREAQQPVFRSNMREAIINEEKQWGFEERDVE